MTLWQAVFRTQTLTLQPIMLAYLGLPALECSRTGLRWVVSRRASSFLLQLGCCCIPVSWCLVVPANGVAYSSRCLSWILCYRALEGALIWYLVQDNAVHRCRAAPT